MTHQHIQMDLRHLLLHIQQILDAPRDVEPGIEPKDPLSSEPKASVKESPIIPSPR